MKCVKEKLPMVTYTDTVSELHHFITIDNILTDNCNISICSNVFQLFGCFLFAIELWNNTFVSDAVFSCKIMEYVEFFVFLTF